MPKRKERAVPGWDRSARADASLGLGRWLNSGGLGGVGKDHAFPGVNAPGPAAVQLSVGDSV
jgi:hypothetical protein